jgi:hypothetical protein
MRKSEYFLNLSSMYDAEIEDLLTDCDGKNVLAKRLKEKREQLPYLLSMLDCSPEMVTPAFFDAFTFSSSVLMEDVLRREPQDSDFPTWALIAPTVNVATWAQPMVETVLDEPSGDNFLVVAATLEFLRRNGHLNSRTDSMDNTDPESKSRHPDDGDDDDVDIEDLAEAGNDWLAKQGFDKLDF